MRAELVLGSERGIRQEYLLEVLVVRTPELAAPGIVEFLDGDIARAQPTLELLPRGGTEIGQRSGFIVQLPAPDPSVVSVAAGHRVDNPRHEVLVVWIRKGHFGADAVLVPLTAIVDAIDRGIAFSHPGRRGRGGRSKNHLETGPVGFGNGLIQPAKIKLPLAWLERGPGELGQVCETKTEPRHGREVAAPLRAWPLLGIVVDADAEQPGLPGRLLAHLLRRGAVQCQTARCPKSESAQGHAKVQGSVAQQCNHGQSLFGDVDCISSRKWAADQLKFAAFRPRPLRGS